MRSDLPIPNIASDSIEKEAPQSVALPLCSIRRRGFTQDMRRRGGFSRILEFINLTPLYFGIAVSSLFSQQSPCFRDNSIFSPLKADKGHGLFLAAISLATRANKELPKAQSSGAATGVDRACGFEQLEKAPEYQLGRNSRWLSFDPLKITP